MLDAAPSESAASSTSSALPPATPIVGLNTPPGAPAPKAAVVPTNLPTTNATANVVVAAAGPRSKASIPLPEASGKAATESPASDSENGDDG